MSGYRKFSVAAQTAIVLRATGASGRILCERCGEWCPKRADYQIDHVIPEGMRPPEDLKRALTPADGQLLCLACHDKKTDKDKGEIAVAHRRQAYAFGLERPDKKKLRGQPKAKRPPYKPPPGLPRLMRQGFIPARGGRS